MTTNDYRWLPMTANDYQWLPVTTNDYQSFSLYKRRERAALVRGHYLLVMGFVWLCWPISPHNVHPTAWCTLPIEARVQGLEGEGDWRFPMFYPVSQFGFLKCLVTLAERLLFIVKGRKHTCIARTPKLSANRVIRSGLKHKFINIEHTIYSVEAPNI